AGLRRLMRVLDRAGDAAGALRAYEHFGTWLAADLGASPSAETQALAEELRRRAGAPMSRPAPPLSEEPGEVEPPVLPVPASPPRPSAPAPAGRVPGRRWTIAAVGGVAVLAALFGSAVRERDPGEVGAPRAEVHPSTRSAAASALFSEGLRAHYAGDGEAARRLYRAALREDTTFAMAALYAASVGGEDYLTMLNRAARLADRWSPDRERLLVRGAWAEQMNHPSGLAVAETLAIRYPEEPDGQLLLGRALIQRGRFAEGAERLRRVIAMDTAGLRTPGARCRACEALPALVSAYHHLEALGDAERLIEEWRRLQPHSAAPLYSLADTRDTQGRYEEALAALRAAAALESPSPWAEVRPAESYLRAGNYAAADALLRTFVREGSPEHRELALWFLVISLRHQGRLREALTAAERYHREFRNELPAAIVLWEMGRLHEAAAAFERISRSGNPDAPPSGHARWRAWSLTHRAGVVAALGDTIELRSLTDTIQVVGARSAYGRDQKLHHHVRGLLWSARGQHDSAIAAFQRAQFSPIYGYNRVNLELARALVRAGRPAEAIPVLRNGLRTGVQATGMYTTMPVLHRALGEAWMAAGRPDSAAAHFRWTLAAHRNADPQFATEMAHLRNRLARLEGMASRTR
ncbi:MAG TPA: tetratricopeptide repeat protein, partial [Longimicrobiaceae bacterium]|nr:tetratricopeptide repeat protein [Longimicrobiaceae bacterium]